MRSISPFSPSDREAALGHKIISNKSNRKEMTIKNENQLPFSLIRPFTVTRPFYVLEVFQWMIDPIYVFLHIQLSRIKPVLPSFHYFIKH